MRSSRSLLIVLPVMLASWIGGRSLAGDLAPASPDEPMAKKFSLESAAGYLDEVAQDWTRDRKCGPCHTNYAFMISRPSIREVGSADAMREIRDFFESRAGHWDDAAKGSKPRWDAEVIATGVTLAINDATTTGKLHLTTRRALDRIWTLQRKDNGFTWLKCDWAPYEHDDYYGAVFAALGVGLAPEGCAKTERATKGLEKLRTYLREHPAPDLHHRAFLLWASLNLDGLMTPEEREGTKRDLLSLQRGDGGWSLPTLGEWKRRDGSPNPKDGPSDGYATGLVVYVLRQAGLPKEDPAIRRGLVWLKGNQRESGRWFTRSLSNDKAHYISNAGTAFAVMARRAGDEMHRDGPPVTGSAVPMWIRRTSPFVAMPDRAFSDPSATFWRTQARGGASSRRRRSRWSSPTAARRDPTTETTAPKGVPRDVRRFSLVVARIPSNGSGTNTIED